MASNKIIHVTSGEKDSDEDEEISTILANQEGKDDKYQHLREKQQGIIIPGEASESDDETEVKKEISRTDLTLNISRDTTISDFVESPVTPSEKNDKVEKEPMKYHSLLHKKLRERNISLHKNLVDLSRNSYQSAFKDLHSTTQQLTKSQMILQDVNNTMRLLTNDLFQLEDRIDVIQQCNILPLIKLP